MKIRWPFVSRRTHDAVLESLRIAEAAGVQACTELCRLEKQHARVVEAAKLGVEIFSGQASTTGALLVEACGRIAELERERGKA